VPLGVVGDVFEVMAQVGRRWTKVNTVGSGVAQLGVRSSPPPVVPSHALTLVKAARQAAEVEKVRKKRVMWLTSGARASAKEKKEEGGGASWAAQRNGPMGLLGLAGSNLAGSGGWLPQFEPTTGVSD
jgi:hypothetical protein